eukprot:EG_transcript_2003
MASAVGSIAATAPAAAAAAAAIPHTTGGAAVWTAPSPPFLTPRGQSLLTNETSTSSTSIFHQLPRPVASYATNRFVRPARGHSSPASSMHSRASLGSVSSLARASVPSPLTMVRSRSQGAAYPIRTSFQPAGGRPDPPPESFRALRQDITSLKAEKERLQERLAQAEVDTQLAIAGSTERCFTCAAMKAEKETLRKQLAVCSQEVAHLRAYVAKLKASPGATPAGTIPAVPPPTGPTPPGAPPASAQPVLIPKLRPRKAAPSESSYDVEAADIAWSEEDAEDLEKSLATSRSRVSGGLSDPGEPVTRMRLPQKAARRPSHQPLETLDAFVEETKLPFTSSSSFDPQAGDDLSVVAAHSPTSQGFSESGELIRVRLPQKAPKRPSRQPSESSDTLVVETKLPLTSSSMYEYPQQSFLSVDSSPRNEGSRVRLPQKAVRRANTDPSEPPQELAIETRLPHTNSAASCRSEMDKPSPSRQRRMVVLMEDNVDHQDSVFQPDNVIQVPHLPESPQRGILRQPSSNPSLNWQEAYQALRAQWEEDQELLHRLQTELEELQAVKPPAPTPGPGAGATAVLSPRPGGPAVPPGAGPVAPSPVGWEAGKDAVIAQLQRHIAQWRESHGQLARHFEALRAQNKALALQRSGAHSSGQEPPGLEWQKGDGSHSLRQQSSMLAKPGGKEVIFGMLGIGVADGMAYGSKLQYRMDYGEARIVDTWAPAKECGVQPGDVVTAINGFPVNNLNDLRLCLLFKPVELTLRRKGERFTVAVTPEAAGPERAPGTRYRRHVVSPESPAKGRPGRSPSKTPQPSANL